MRCLDNGAALSAVDQDKGNAGYRFKELRIFYLTGNYASMMDSLVIGISL